MNPIQQIPTELLSALALFVKELDGHLVFFSSFLGELERSENEERLDQLQEKAVAMEHRFHVIKGAASFFKLQDIRVTAVEGEKLFKNGKLTTDDDTEALTTLKRIFTSLSTESSELRTAFSRMS